jgi:hypothetical protein
LQWHPDRNRENQKEAEQKFKEARMSHVQSIQLKNIEIHTIFVNIV